MRASKRCTFVFFGTFSWYMMRIAYDCNRNGKTEWAARKSTVMGYTSSSHSF